MITTKKIAVSAILVALNVILTRYVAINTMIVKINFSFIPLVVAAIYLGPVYAGIINALEDVIGTFLVSVGAFNPAFTITAFLAGFVYGLLLYPGSPVFKGFRKFGRGVGRLLSLSESGCDTFALFLVSFVTGTIVLLAFGLAANTFLIHHYFGYSYAVLLPSRIIKTIIMIPLHTVMIPLISTKLIPQLKKLPSF